MELLNIEATERSPRVVLDPFAMKFEISGESRPENAGKFYEPILQWLEQFNSILYWQNEQFENSKKMTLEFKMDYFNSTSAKYLLDILKLIDVAHTNGCSVKINWLYDSRDEDMLESGEEFSQLVNIPFEFVAK